MGGAEIDSGRSSAEPLARRLAPSSEPHGRSAGGRLRGADIARCLIVAGNGLTYLPETIASLKNLKELDAHQNHIKVFPRFVNNHFRPGCQSL